MLKPFCVCVYCKLLVGEEGLLCCLCRIIVVYSVPLLELSVTLLHPIHHLGTLVPSYLTSSFSESKLSGGWNLEDVRGGANLVPDQYIRYSVTVAPNKFAVLSVEVFVQLFSYVMARARTHTTKKH